MANYESKAEQVEKLETKVTRLEEDIKKKGEKKRVSILLNDNKEELKGTLSPIVQVLVANSLIFSLQKWRIKFKNSSVKRGLSNRI